MDEQLIEPTAAADLGTTLFRARERQRNKIEEQHMARPNQRSDDPAAALDMLRLRLAVGFLGERSQPAWWQSGFLGPSAAAFLDPIFGSNRLLTQYRSVSEAARRVHDDRIGVGRVSHLFRLPETTEQLLAAEIGRLREVEPQQNVSSEAWAVSVFDELCPAASGHEVGPVRLGPTGAALTQSGLQSTASHYRSAFLGSVQCFPYFSDR